MADYTMEEIKQIIRSIAISGASTGISVQGLVQDFKKMEGFDLPFYRMGFGTADDFLRSLPDTVTVRNEMRTLVDNNNNIFWFLIQGLWLWHISAGQTCRDEKQPTHPKYGPRQ